MKKCPVCSSDDTFLYMKGIFDCDNTSVLECRSCGLQFLDPMMSDEEEAEYYRNYYENQKTRHFSNLNMKDIQSNALAHYEQYHKVYFDLVKNADRILEVGCGSGGFIKFIKKNFPDKQITAVERSDSNLTFLRGKENSDLSDVSFFSSIDDVATSDHDLVVAFGVLEHVKDSVSFISSHVALLRGGGRIAYNIPHPKNPLIEIYELEEFKKFIYMKQHYYEFSEQSLAVLANKVGCTVDCFNYLQVWSLDNHISWLKNRKPANFSKYTRLLSPEIIKAYNNTLIEKKITDLMQVVFKKDGNT